LDAILQLGAFTWYLPALTRRALRGKAMLRLLPITMTAGIAIFGAAGMMAGMRSMPRRTLDVSYDGTAPYLWTAVSPYIGIGAGIMCLSLLAYVIILMASAMGNPATRDRALDRSTRAKTADIGQVLSQPSWTAPVCILALVIAMYAATAVAFALLHSLPLTSVAGVNH
jgi:cytochrome c oxidase subunit I